jgi:hypothetical protein
MISSWWPNNESVFLSIIIAYRLTNAYTRNENQRHKWRYNWRLMGNWLL